MTRSQVWAEIEKKAEIAASIGQQQIAATKEQRIDASLGTDEVRRLREQYTQAAPDFDPFSEVGKVEPPEPSELEKMHAEVVEVAKSDGADSRAYALAMSKRQAALGHDVDAERWADLAPQP